jgi:hypothetical protein
MLIRYAQFPIQPSPFFKCPSKEEEKEKTIEANKTKEMSITSFFATIRKKMLPIRFIDDALLNLSQQPTLLLRLPRLYQF